MFEAEWSGSGFALCMGEWRIKYEGMTLKWPEEFEELQDGHMNTEGTYDEWHFEDWQEVWETYEDGLSCEEWAVEYQDFIKALFKLNNLTYTAELAEELYEAFKQEDFRSNSCGGCI